MFDSLHHAREHLSLEQDLALLRWLTDGYGTDSRITNIVDTPRDLDRVHGQPRRRRVRPDRLALSRVAQEPPAERRDRRAIGTDVNRNYGYHWACCGGSSSTKSSSTYHGVERVLDARGARRSATSWPAAAIGGRQQIKTAITFHTAGEQILWPYGYTKTDVPARHDRRGPRRARRARQEDGGDQRLHGDAVEQPVRHRRRRDRLGVRRTKRIFMYTMELYPSHSQVSTDRAVLPARREDRAARRERNKEAILMLIEAAGCPYAADRQGDPGLRPAVRHVRDLRRLDDEPARHRHGDRRRLAARQPGRDHAARPGTMPSGSRGLVTGAEGRRRRAHSYDVDGGVTTVRSRAGRRSRPTTGSLTFRYYLAHSSNSSSARLLPRLRRGRDREADHRQAGARGREHRPPDLVDRERVDGAVGRPDGPDRLRRGRPRPGEHGRGGRRRRADHPPVSGSRTRSSCPPPGGRRR